MKKLVTLIIVSILLGNQFLYPSRLAYADDETASTPPTETESDVPVTPPSDNETAAPVDTPTEEVVSETTDATDEIATTSTDEIAASTTEATGTDATTTDTEIVATSTESAETIEATSTPETETTSNVTETSATTIVSGQAVALANILNIINTNFLNSTGVIFFANFFDYLKETLDLRTLLENGTACATTPCTSGDELSINMSSDATINNDILIDAETGNNTIDNSGNATIDTGNAYAGLNLVNLANNNFVDTNYLLVTLNAFNGVGGDIVFPSLDQFLNSLSTGATSPNAIDLESQAEINNNVNLETNSGDNQTTDTATSTITTGDAHSSSNVFNQINTNVASDNRVSILFRIHGNWAGQVFGAPPGLAWMQGPDGSIYMFDNASSTASGNSGGQTADITNTSHALINNNVSVIALTGENQIDGASTALISTGDAYAGANIVNVANSNVVGKNWILAIINIFGDFTGNIAFGRPDLWVGEQVETPAQVKNGGELTYKFTVINNGDSPSSNTILTNDYDANHLEIINSSIPYQKNDQGELTWDLGTLPAGAATELNYQARIINADDNGTVIDNTAKVFGHETDNNDADNTDMVTITTDTIQHGGSSGSRIRNRVSITANNSNTATSTDKRLEVTRDNLATILNDNQNISHQELVVKNPSDNPIDAVILHDILKNSSGQIIKDEAWNLGTILAHEEITIGYDIQFSADAPGGLYTLTTAFDQFRNDNIPNGYILINKSTPKPAILTSATVEPEPEPEPEPTSTNTPAVTPQVAMVAAVDNSKTGNVPRIPLALPAILTMASIGIWGSYRRKLMI